MNEHLKTILNSFSGIFFLNNPLVGGLLFVVTLINPNQTATGLVAVLSAYLFARFLKVEKEFLLSGYYTYNPLLVGLAIGYVFQINSLTLFFVVTLGILTFLITSFLYRIFSAFLLLPILSLPYVVVSSLAYLASGNYSNLLVNGLYPRFHSEIDLMIPFWLNGYFKALGAIFFLPYSVAGIAFALLVFLSSRILFTLTLLGYFTGTLVTGMMVGSFEQAFSNIYHFNFILIAMCLGGVYLIPGPKSYLLSVIAVVTAPLLLDSVHVFWSVYGIPAFTFPFILVSLLYIYVLGMFDSPLIARSIKATPEETLDHHLTDALRFRGSKRSVSLPFTGTWTVSQSFDGDWTHKDSWRYAYDFVIADEAGNTSSNSGKKVEDYHAFGKPVLSPTRGRVLKAVSSLPDNPIGHVDHANNWGNLVVIQDSRGFFVELSHFSQDSIRVAEGDWVEKGHLLGLCGNSGYSPQPHIHIQVQATEIVGANTLPFSFTGYLSGKTYHANDLPEKDEKVMPLKIDENLDQKTSFILDTEFEYDVFEDGRKVDEVLWEVKMDADSTFYFVSEKGRLYFGKKEGTFYCHRVEGNDPAMKALMQALPRLPLGYNRSMEWEDSLTVHSVLKPMQKPLALFLASFNHNLNTITAQYRYDGKRNIVGEIRSDRWNVNIQTFLELDEETGFKTIKSGTTTVKRK